jgi:3-deoxy-manno-octulosonate cytidylyltransferase (CMP-KDO synthetase)
VRRVAVIIPARFGASRLPGKPIADIHGKPLVAWVVERARSANGVDVVLVATDDDRIAEAARAAGAEAVVTGPAETGTDRVAQAARGMLPRPTIVVNLQGDEPFMEPAAVEAIVHAMDEGGSEMATMARPLDDGEWERPEVVKVVTDFSGNALYFSRAPIPARRGRGPSPLARAHVGMYAFTAAFLERFAALTPGRLEREEQLEQLRALEHGYRIRVVDTTYRGFGVDTPQDLERARALVAAGREAERGRSW